MPLANTSQEGVNMNEPTKPSKPVRIITSVTGIILGLCFGILGSAVIIGIVMLGYVAVHKLKKMGGK